MALLRCLAVLVLTSLCPAALAQPAPEGELAPAATEAFIEETGETQVWSDANYDALIGALQGLEAHGLTPAHYHLTALDEARGDPARRDRLATDAWMSAAAHMLFGKLDPRTREPDWTAARRPADLAAVLAYALDSNTVATSLEQLAPIQPAYGLLKTELAGLREISAAPISKISEGPALKTGMTGPRVEELQARLVELGMLDATAASGEMDAPTIDAVETAQAAYGLDVDGVAGAATVRALNRGTQGRIDQVRVNMERWRWLPGDLGRRHLRANIAGFEVTAVEDGVAQRTHLTIVGRTYRQTPTFSDVIEYIVFNPWWETPDSLARADKLPLFKRDPGAVGRLGFQVIDRASGKVVSPASIDWTSLSASNFPYRLRQAPGPQNALGQVKIMFPNPYTVYLHDTPSRGLFALEQRAFSAGCIRTQDPLGLSEWLLEETEGWDRAAIDKAVASGKETRAELAAGVPVHILYFTAVNDGAGGVRYLDDLYERDGPVLAGLDAPPGPAPQP